MTATVTKRRRTQRIVPYSISADPTYRALVRAYREGACPAVIVSDYRQEHDCRPLGRNTSPSTAVRGGDAAAQRFIRQLAGSYSTAPIRVIDGNCAPTETGERGYAKRRDGFKARYSRSKVKVEIGRDWLHDRGISPSSLA